MWRPKGWDFNYYYYNSEDDNRLARSANEAREAGADAMLQILRGEGEHMRPHFGIFEGDIRDEGGTWVFIPDDKETAEDGKVQRH